MIGHDPVPNLPQADDFRVPEGSEDPTDSGKGKEGPSGLLVAPVEYELKVAWVTFQLHQLNTLDKVPVRGASAWHMVSSFWTFLLARVQQAVCGVWPGGARDAGSTSLHSGLSSPPIGLADRNPGVCPARRGTHAAREQGEHPCLSSPARI